MPADLKTSILYRFSHFEVDVAAGQLRKHGVKVRLAGQPFDILVLMLERPGEVVTREEIQQQLWSDETFVDFENSLNKAINKLRQALSDSAEKPTYIETLPRRGYRFIGSVERVEPNIGSPAGTPLPGEMSPPPDAVASSAVPHQGRKWLLAGVLSAAALGGVLWLLLWPEPVPHVVNVTPLTTASRADMFGGLETDGVRLFFLQRFGHRWELSQMPASGGPVQPLNTPFSNAKLFAISPDGAEFLIAPFESRDDLLPLWIMPSVGGTPRRVGQALALDATFSPDGKRITYCNNDGIFEIGRDGLASRKLLDAKGTKDSLAWSPDAKILYFSWAAQSQAAETLWSVDVNGENLQQVLPNWKGAEGEWAGRWSRDGHYFTFLGVNSDNSRTLWILRSAHGIFRNQNLPVRLNAGHLFLDSPMPSADGRHVYVLGRNFHTELVRYDEKGREFRSLMRGQPGLWPAFRSQGDFVIYSAEKGALWRSKLDGSDSTQLVSAGLQPALAAVHPDGKIIAFRGYPSGSPNSQIYTVSIDGGEPAPIVKESVPVDAPAWSGDGSKLIFSMNPQPDTSGGLYVFDMNTHQSQKVPGSEGYWKSRWSPDGKYLVSVTSNNKSIGVFEWSSQQWTVIVHGSVLSPVAWSKDSRFVYYQDLLEEDEPVRRFNIKTGTSEKMVDCHALLEGGVQRCGFEAVMPDGSVVLRLTRGDHDVFSLDLDVP